MGIERRKYRSNNPNIALQLQLEHSKLCAEAEAMLLVDDEGFIISSSEGAEEYEEIAILCPSMGRSEKNRWEGAILFSNKTKPLVVQKFEVGLSQLFLCCIGGLPGLREIEMQNVIEGVRRILKETDD